MHLTNKEILDKLLSYSEDLKHHYNLYQLLLFHLFFRLCLKPSSKIKRKSSTPFNYLIPTPNWKPPIISSNLSSTMPLVLGTLKTSKKKGRNLSFLDLRFLQPTTVDKEPKNVSPHCVLFLVHFTITQNRLLLHNKKEV
ncbi:transposase-like protein [Streptococcus pneumoniae]|nr:transposase-like protein [Streptococcus pneumoniae]CGG99992.1 transposase-like protein [Streptococcus pneumoniae]CIR73326.1 transposase-like protein [Streptococcus pneumoniae]CIW12821.1 transposase-like protein [Streptococcus pneumoniae]CJD18012.1 transposase-like protein [Streptococcus pneumoniae]